MNRSNKLPEEAQVRDLLDAYCSGVISDDQIRELESYMMSDEATRLEFITYLYLHTELCFAARARRSADSVPGTIGTWPESRGTGWWRRWVTTGRRWHLCPMAVWACALIVLADVAILRPWGIAPPWPKAAAPRPMPNRGDLADRAPKTTSSDAALAMVVKQDGALWEATDGPTPEVGVVMSGRRLQLISGRATLAFLNGVTLTVEGPADLELVSPDRVFCHRGRLRARIPEGAEGFVVASPASAVVDLGTEFGLNVEDDASSQLMVFEGEAVAALLDVAGSPKRTQHVEPRKAFALNPRTGQIGETVARPEGFVPASQRASPRLVLDPAYVGAVLGSRPRGYWRFEHRAGDAISNEIPGGPPLRVHGPVDIAVAPEGNGCARFKAGAPEQYLSTNSLWAPAREPGHAVELWFLADAIRYASLVGLYPPSEFNVPEERAFVAHYLFVELTSRNRLYNLYKPASVRFLHRWPLDTRVGNNIVSAETFAPQRWHHVVAQKRGDRMELYFDGVPDKSMPPIPDHETVSCHLVVGRRTSDPLDRNDLRPFVGQLDELAIYDHPLSAEEVRHHFRLAASHAERR
jgi:hypothetical protein